MSGITGKMLSAKRVGSNFMNTFDSDYAGVDQAMSDISVFGRNMNPSSIGMLKNLYSSIGSEKGKAYTDTVEGRANVQMASNQARNSKNRLKQDANLMGLSQEAYLAGMNNINQGESDLYRGFAANADARRSNLTNQQLSTANALGGQEFSLQGQKLNTLAQILQGKMGLLNQKAGIFGQGVNAKLGWEQGKADREMQRKAANSGIFGQLIGGAANIGASFIGRGG